LRFPLWRIGQHQQPSAQPNQGQCTRRRSRCQRRPRAATGKGLYALQKCDFIVLFPINPATLARYRQAFKPSGAKDDPTDAELALDLLVCHRDKFTPLQPQSAPMRTLIHLVEQRRQLVNDKLRFTNRLGNALKQYYPQGTRLV
jgi:Transposase